MSRMNKFFLLFLSGLIPTSNASFLYIVNHEGINIESKCQDGKAEHQIWHTDVGGKVQKLNLKGHGTVVYKNPKLRERNIYKSEKGYIESKEIHKKAREESSKEVSTTLIREEVGNQLAFLENN